jgi:hypothetical protein
VLTAVGNELLNVADGSPGKVAAGVGIAILLLIDGHVVADDGLLHVDDDERRLAAQTAARLEGGLVGETLLIVLGEHVFPDLFHGLISFYIFFV